MPVHRDVAQHVQLSRCGPRGCRPASIVDVSHEQRVEFSDRNLAITLKDECAFPVYSVPRFLTIIT